MWPGWTRSYGFVSGWIATWMVWLRSAAEMPVVTPSRASTETVNAVPSGASLWSVIGRRPSWSARSSVRQRQISPRACVAMKLIASGRRELRGDRRGRPRSRGRDRRRRRRSGPRGCPRSPPRSVANGVVTAIADRLAPSRSRSTYFASTSTSRFTGSPGRERAERGRLERVRDQRDREAGVVERGDRQARPLDRDRALLDDVAEELGRSVEPDAAAVAFGLDAADGADAVDVALDVVAAERLAGAQRRLEVDARSRRRAGRATCARASRAPRRTRASRRRDDRQADAVDRDRVAERGPTRRRDLSRPSATRRRADLAISP